MIAFMHLLFQAELEGGEMGDRRMVSRKIVDSAKFLKMPATSQNLYFHLLVNADDDGIVEAYRVINMCKANEDDLRILVGKGFVTVLNEDLVTYIEDWMEQNKIRADRKTDSIYKKLLLQVKPDVVLLEKKERSDVKKSSNKDGQSMDGPRTAQGKGIEDKSNQDKGIEDKSINLSHTEVTKEGEKDYYRTLIADNIKLNSLLDFAKVKDGDYRTDEVDMVNEIYEIICDMVCNPREGVKICQIDYPWESVKERFLKLQFVHIANILNKFMERQDTISNMHGYIVSALYKESMSGTLANQAEIHDDYLNSLRGHPYAV